MCTQHLFDEESEFIITGSYSEENCGTGNSLCMGGRGWRKIWVSFPRIYKNYQIKFLNFWTTTLWPHYFLDSYWGSWEGGEDWGGSRPPGATVVEWSAGMDHLSTPSQKVKSFCLSFMFTLLAAWVEWLRFQFRSLRTAMHYMGWTIFSWKK